MLMVEFSSFVKNPQSGDPLTKGQALADDLIAGKKSLIDVRKYLMSIKHPGERLKTQFEFSQRIRLKLGLNNGIDKWGDYVNSLKKLQSQFNQIP